MKKILILILLAIGFNTFAQKNKIKTPKDSVKTEIINVVSTYNPTISDATKIKKEPSIELDKKNQKKKLTYKIFSAPVASTFIPKSGTLKSINLNKKEQLYNSYVAAGYGNFSTPFIDAFLYKKKKYDTFGGYFNYLSSEDGVKNAVLDNGFYRAKVGGFYTRKEKKLTWKVGLNAQQKQFNWYGLPSNDFDPAVISQIDEDQKYSLYELEGAIELEDSVVDKIQSKISLFDDQFNSDEIEFTLKSEFQIPLKSVSKKLNNLNLSTSIHYLQGDFLLNYAADAIIEYGFLNLGAHPTYHFSYNNFNFTLGAKAYLTSDIENSITDFLLYPDVEISYPLLQNYVNMYLGAGGDLYMNSFQQYVERNPFVSPTLFMTQTNEQYNIYGGITGKLADNMSFNFKASYKNTEDQPLFVRNNSKSDGTIAGSPNTLRGFEYGNSFSVFYDDIKTLSISAKIELELSKQFSLSGQAYFHSYNLTNQQEAWNLPNFETIVTGKYQYDKWHTGFDIFMVGERKDVLYSDTYPSALNGSQTLDSYVDININSGYHFSNKFSVFLKMNNILNNNYQRFANFNVQGFQILGGLVYKFNF